MSNSQPVGHIQPSAAHSVAAPSLPFVVMAMVLLHEAAWPFIFTSRHLRVGFCEEAKDGWVSWS